MLKSKCCNELVVQIDEVNNIPIGNCETCGIGNHYFMCTGCQHECCVVKLTKEKI